MVKTNERGEFVVDQGMKTNLSGVFAAGDCVAKRYRQVTTAVSDGTIDCAQRQLNMSGQTCMKEVHEGVQKKRTPRSRSPLLRWLT